MKYKIKDYPEIKEKIKTMTDEDLLAAVCCPNIWSDNVGPYRNTGSIFLHTASNEILKKRIEIYNKDRELPALIVTDVERGAGFLEDGTEFPSMRAPVEAADPELSYKMGKISALEAGKSGFQWGFGPCVDILGNKDNPIVGNRGGGTDVDAIIKNAVSLIKGMQENGLIACAKHFPGDGYCDYDQHLTTAVNPLSREDWEKSYGKLYKTLIEEGLKTIMPGHISLPSMDEVDEETGVCPPATLSKNLLSGLLREKLGFEGIIVSDATNMGGFCGYMNYYRACAEFLKAGGDILLFVHPDKKFMTEMKKHLSSGALTRYVLEDRAYRVLSFAKEHQNCISKEECIKSEHQTVADEITRKAIIVERDRKKLLPVKIKEGMKILYYIISAYGDEAIDGRMVEELKKYTSVLDKKSDLGPDQILNIVQNKEYDLIICRVSPMQSYGINSARLSGVIARNMMGGWQKYDTPIVFVTHSSSLASEYEVAIDTLINTRGYSLNSAHFICEKIFDISGQNS